MDIFLVIFYALIFSFLIWHPRLFKSAGLSKPFLLSVFLIKCVLGIFYTYLHIQKYGGGDILAYFNDANIIYNTLLTQPVDYLHLTFGPNGGPEPESIKRYIHMMGYWGDTSAYVVVRFNAVVHLFSFGNFYVHVIFMAFLSLVGLYLVYLSVLLAAYIPNHWIKWSIFLIPSMLFWTSGVHKEGIIIFGLGLFFFSVTQLSRYLEIKHLALFILSCMLLYFTRDFILMLLIPGLIAYLASLAVKKYVPIIFFIVYLTFVIAGSWFFILDGMNYLELIAFKQHLFKSLEAGSSNISISEFHPSLKSLLLEIPQALTNSFLGPFLIKPTSPLHWMAIAENILLVFMLGLILIFTSYKDYQFHPMLMWFLCFAISFFILIGYIVPNVGAIVRYRSVCWPFLFAFLLFNVRDRY